MYKTIKTYVFIYVRTYVFSSDSLTPICYRRVEGQVGSGWGVWLQHDTLYAHPGIDLPWLLKMKGIKSTQSFVVYGAGYNSENKVKKNYRRQSCWRFNEPKMMGRSNGVREDTVIEMPLIKQKLINAHVYMIKGILYFLSGGYYLIVLIGKGI